MRLYFSFLILLLLHRPGFADVGRHMVLVSDSRGNCAFGEEFNRLLRTVESGYVHSMAVGGSSPMTWLDEKRRIVSPYGIEEKGEAGIPLKLPRKTSKTRTPFFPAFLTGSFMANPGAKKLTIINLGTNAFKSEILQKDSQRMVLEVFAHNSDCAWISPPHNRTWNQKKNADYLEAIKAGIDAAGEGGPSKQKCFLINSLELSEYPSNLPKGPSVDGVHYCWHPELIKRGKEWARGAFEKLKQQFSLTTTACD